MNSSIQLLSGTFWNVLNQFVVACVGLVATDAGILHMEHLQAPGDDRKGKRIPWQSLGVATPARTLG